MTAAQLEALLARLGSVRIAVYGDFCLDAYWVLDPSGSEISVETGLQGRAVNRQSYTLGGGSNVVANVAALSPAAVRAIGVIGDDLFGREIERQFRALGVDGTHLFRQGDGFDTVTFAKPHLDDAEQARLDFGFRNRRSRGADQQILGALRDAFAWADAIILNQQVPGSIPDRAFIDEVNQLLAAFPETIAILDSRHYAGLFEGVMLKANAGECAALCGEAVPAGAQVPFDKLESHARALSERHGRPVFVTRGERGMLVLAGGQFDTVPGIQLTGPIDPVGAGDTILSALALALGAGATPQVAAQFANLAAAVTVGKIQQTGTASVSEIRSMSKAPAYVHRPDLADRPRQARYLSASEVEVCADWPSGPAVRHLVFDHDGTISTLRQGWEEVMQPVMEAAILGDAADQVDAATRESVRQQVTAYIDASTGIQTILQMEALVAMVRAADIVPEDSVLDAAGYKAVYNDMLMARVASRLEKLRRGELAPEDLTLKGAVAFLRRLHDRGIRLYLASGTDRDDVVAEAEALGYADLFGGRIHGSVGDVSKYSKRKVIEGILAEHAIGGPELAVIGDGPVEVREAQRHDGRAIGVASDEIRRYGLNAAKRRRLIRAGAHVIVPDFSQPDALLTVLDD